MQRHRGIKRLFLLAAFMIAVTAVVETLPSRGPVGFALIAQQKASKAEGQKNEEDKMPVAIYSASLPIAPRERALRLARNGRYDKRYPLAFDELASGDMGRIVASDWNVYMPALPAAESDVVAIAELDSANAHLSNDRTGAYSEFTLRVVQVFKHDGRTTVKLGGSIIGEREGAVVQLASGRTIRYGISGQGIPQIGRRYVFFLKYNTEGEDYQILTGYQLSNGHVFPIDKVDPFLAYENADENIFLDAVNETVSRPREKRR